MVLVLVVIVVSLLLVTVLSGSRKSPATRRNTDESAVMALITDFLRFDRFALTGDDESA